MANEVCYRTLGLDRPWSIETYMSVGGYEAWKKILGGQLTPDQVIDEVKKSGLRGRGGAIDEVALAQLPLSSQSPARPLRLDTAAGTLGTALYEPPRGDGGDGTWSVPLPASRLQPGDVSP